MPIDLINRIISETLERFGSGASYGDYRTVAFDLFPEEMEAMGKSFARSGFTKWLKDGMRKAFNIDESNPDAPQVQLDLMPGLAAPAYINIGSWSVPQPKRFQDCCVDDLDTAINTRRVVYARTGARIEDLQQKRAWLVAHVSSESETIAEVCDRLSSGSVTGDVVTDSLHPVS